MGILFVEQRITECLNVVISFHGYSSIVVMIEDFPQDIERGWYDYCWFRYSYKYPYIKR